MKKLALLLMLLPLTFNPAVAGSEQGYCKHGGKGKYMERMTDNLDLTPEQTEQVQAIMNEKREKMHALWKKQREQLQPQMKKIDSEANDKLAAVLDEDQMQKYREKKEAMQKLMRERRQQRLQERKQEHAGE